MTCVFTTADGILIAKTDIISSSSRWGMRDHVMLLRDDLVKLMMKGLHFHQRDVQPVSIYDVPQQSAKVRQDESPDPSSHHKGSKAIRDAPGGVDLESSVH